MIPQGSIHLGRIPLTFGKLFIYTNNILHIHGDEFCNNSL